MVLRDRDGLLRNEWKEKLLAVNLLAHSHFRWYK